MTVDLSKIGTEQRNKNTMNIDRVSTYEIIRLINEEDKTVAYAVEKALPQIALAVDAIVRAFENGGRLIYIGAGTSGRLGILDAAECRPTFSVSDEMVQCLMAGGPNAMVSAIEGAEDSTTMPIEDLKRINLNNNDIVIGIAASGRTPYAVAGVKYAKKLGCDTGCITTSPNSEIAGIVKYPIEAITGAEPITGSTRMKSGTAQKMILNMLSTASMIKMGKVYQNLLVDMQPTNVKLFKRAQRIIMDAAGVSESVADAALKKYKTIKKTVIALLTNIEDEAKIDDLLANARGNIHQALKDANYDETCRN